MEPVKARSSVPATGSAEAAAGTCMAAAWSASVASQRRSTQRRASRGPSPPPRPMAHAHALVTGSVPAAALSSTLPRPSCRPILPTTTSLHHPLHLPPTHYPPPTSHHHLPHLFLPPPTTGVLLPMPDPKANGRGAVRRLGARPARGVRLWSTERPADEPGAPELRTAWACAWPRNTQTFRPPIPGPGTSPDPSLRPPCARCVTWCVTATGHAARAGVTSTAAGTSAKCGQGSNPT
jgi:hypothetical protein